MLIPMSTRHKLRLTVEGWGKTALHAKIKYTAAFSAFPPRLRKLQLVQRLGEYACVWMTLLYVFYHSMRHFPTGNIWPRCMAIANLRIANSKSFCLGWNLLWYMKTVFRPDYRSINSRSFLLSIYIFFYCLCLGSFQVQNNLINSC